MGIYPLIYPPWSPFNLRSPTVHQPSELTDVHMYLYTQLVLVFVRSEFCLHTKACYIQRYVQGVHVLLMLLHSLCSTWDQSSNKLGQVPALADVNNDEGLDTRTVDSVSGFDSIPQTCDVLILYSRNCGVS